MNRLHPMSKLAAVMVLTIGVFLIDKLSICVSLTAALILFRFFTGYSRNSRFSFKIKPIINFFMLAAFIILIQTFFGRGLYTGLAISCRVLSLFFIFPILTKSTPPGVFAAGLNSSGFPYRTAFTITTAFNQVPRFQEEAGLIIDAQKLRGCSTFDKNTGFRINGLFNKLKSYAGILFPLVLGAMRKAQVTSVAMDSRAFGAHKTRSWLERPQVRLADILFVLGCIIFIVLLLVLNNADYQF